MTNSTIYNLVAIVALISAFLYALTRAITPRLGDFLILKAKRPDRAVSFYTFMLKLLPRSSSFYITRSWAYLELQEYQRAIQDCNTALSLKANLPAAYNNQGVAYRDLHQYELAIQDFNRAIELAPHFVLARVNRASVRFSLQQYQAASQELNHVLSRNPNFERALELRGFIHLRKKEYQQALQYFNRVLAQNPENASYYHGRGNVYIRFHDYQRALQDFERAIALAPMDAIGYHNRGDTYLCLNNIAQAKADFHKCQELEPKSILHHWMNEVCILCFESPDEGMPERLEKLALLDANPRYQDYYLVQGCRGWAHWLRGHFEKALEEFEQAILKAPHDEDIYVWIGVACAALGRDEEAKGALEHARKEGVPDYMFRMLKLLKKTRPDFLEQYGSRYLQEQVTAQVDA